MLQLFKDFPRDIAFGSVGFLRHRKLPYKETCDNNSPQWANIMAVKLTKGWYRMNYEEEIVNLKS